MINKILQTVGMGGDVENRFKVSTQIARFYNAHLYIDFTYVSPKDSIPRDIFLMSKSKLEQLSEISEQHAIHYAKECEEILKSICDEKALQKSISEKGFAVHWRMKKGLRSYDVARQVLIDLFIFPFPKSGQLTNSIRAALYETDIPSLLIPRKQTNYDPKRIGIIWQGNSGSAKSLKNAVSIKGPETEFVVFASNNGLSENNNAPAVKQYLDLCEINSEIVNVEDNLLQSYKFFDEIYDADIDILSTNVEHNTGRYQNQFASLMNQLTEDQGIPLLLCSKK